MALVFVEQTTDRLPTCNMRAPYNETEFVVQVLFHKNIRDFLRSSTISENAVAWSPEGSHHLDLDEARCVELDISDTANSLIRFLPSSADYGVFPIFLKGCGE